MTIITRPIPGLKDLTTNVGLIINKLEHVKIEPEPPSNIFLNKNRFLLNCDYIYKSVDFKSNGSVRYQSCRFMAPFKIYHYNENIIKEIDVGILYHFYSINDSADKRDYVKILVHYKNNGIDVGLIKEYFNKFSNMNIGIILHLNNKNLNNNNYFTEKNIFKTQSDMIQIVTEEDVVDTQYLDIIDVSNGYYENIIRNELHPCKHTEYNGNGEITQFLINFFQVQEQITKNNLNESQFIHMLLSLENKPTQDNEDSYSNSDQ